MVHIRRIMMQAIIPKKKKTFISASPVYSFVIM